MADHVKVTVGLGYSMVLFGTTQAQVSVGIGVISMAMAAPNMIYYSCNHTSRESDGPMLRVKIQTFRCTKHVGQ